MATAGRTSRPNVIVTGFSVFPGAPVNPSEALALALGERAGDLADSCRVRCHVLDVEYEGLGHRLADLARDFEPDIAIHFGLAAMARGFRLEHAARNRADPDMPDNAGRRPRPLLLAGGPPLLRSTLPVERLEAELVRSGLPVTQDDSAGEYLCNALFYLSRSASCGGFRPAMSGFIHVPHLPPGEGGPTGGGPCLSLASLLDGAERIVRILAAEWRSRFVSP